MGIKTSLGLGVIDADGRERVVVDADSCLHTHPLGGQGGVGGAHGEVVADAQHGEVEFVSGSGALRSCAVPTVVSVRIM